MRNFREYSVGIIAAIGLVSAILSLLTTRWKEVSSVVRVRRSLLIGTLFVLALVAAIVSTPVPPVPPPETAAKTSSMKLAPAPTVNTTAPLTTPSVALEPVRIYSPLSVIRDADGRSVPQLVVVAQRAIDTTLHHVEGTLSSSTRIESDQRLKGLITVRLTLDIRVMTRGVLTAAFTIDSRGGGFTEAVATQQAQERLAASFRERLRQEVPQ